MNAVLAALAFLVAGSLPTFEEIQKGMYSAYRSLPHFEDQWEFTLQKGSEPAVHQAFDRKIDKERSAFSASVQGQPVFKQVHDGKTFGLLMISGRVYAKSTTPNEEFSRSYEQAMKKPDENSFNYYVQAYDVWFVSNPPFVVTSDEPVDLDGAKTRKITAVAKRTDGSATLTLRYWLEPSRWILRRIELDGISAAAGTFTIKGELKMIDFDAKLPASEFLLSADQVQGYREVPLSELKSG